MNWINKKTYWIISLVCFYIILFQESIRVYSISIVLFILIICLSIKSSEFRSFFKKSWYIYCLVFIAFLWGVFGPSDHFWHDFEVSSILLTLAYSIFIYVKLYTDKEVNKQAVVSVLPFLLFAIILISMSVWACVGGGLEIGDNTGLLSFKISGTRNTTLGLLTLGTALYGLINYILAISESRYKDIYIKSLQYSDIPVIVTFALLWSSTLKIHNAGSPEYDSFYGGVIAFQMIYSNIVWAFIDDPIIERIYRKE